MKGYAFVAVSYSGHGPKHFYPSLCGNQQAEDGFCQGPGAPGSGTHTMQSHTALRH